MSGLCYAVGSFALVFAFLLAHLAEAEAMLDKRDVEALLREQCPRQCSGEISYDSLERICTCMSRPGAFIYGKRGGDRQVADNGLKRIVGLPPNGEKTDLNAKRAITEEELLQILDKKVLQQRHYYDTTDSLLPATIDIEEQVKQILSQTRRSSDTATDFHPSYRPDSENRDLFKSEIGKDIVSATKEDYLNWIKKELKIAESRLVKLMKFYEYVKSTPDTQ